MWNYQLRKRVVFVNPKIFPTQEEAIEEQKIAMESFNKEMSSESREISDRIKKRSEDLLNKFDSSKLHIDFNSELIVNQKIESDEEREKRIKKQREIILNKINK